MFPLQKSDNNTKYIENYRLVTLVNIDIKILKILNSREKDRVNLVL